MQSQSQSQSQAHGQIPSNRTPGTIPPRLTDTWSSKASSSTGFNSLHQLDTDIDTQSQYTFSNSTTPSPSMPALSRDSVISNSTRIQTPITCNRISTSSSSASSTSSINSSSQHVYHPQPLSLYSDPFQSQSHSSKMTTTTATQSIPISIPMNLDTTVNPHYTYNFNHTTIHPSSEHHLSHPYQLAINYMQDHSNQYAPSHYDQSVVHGQQHLGVSGWAPLISPSTINPQLMEATPSRSLSPESNASFSPSILPVEEVVATIQPRATVPKPSSSSSSTDEWYDGPSEWIRSVAEAHKRRRESYLANPKAWPKGEGEPKELQPLTDHCRFPHLWEVEQARKDLTEDAVVAKLMKKSEATISKEFARCQKAGEEFKPPRPMNSAMAFADFRRPQWGDMYSDMKTGSISTWLSAEWRALKDLRPEEFDWWTRVSKKYWDKYVEDYDYKFTRAPNGEGKGSKKRKAKARENAAREKAIRLTTEAARRSSSSRGLMGRRPTTGSTRGSLAPPMNILMPDQLQHQGQAQYLNQSYESPNILGLSGVPHHHLTPTTMLTPSNATTQVPYNATGYFDGYTFPLTEGSRTPSPPQLLTPLEAPHSSHGHTHSPGPYQQQTYYYPTQAQMNYAHQQVQHAHQVQQQQQHQQQIARFHSQQQQAPPLQISICNTGSYYQNPLNPNTTMNTHEYFNQGQQTPTSHSHGVGHHIPTLAPHNIPSPQ